MYYNIVDKHFVLKAYHIITIPILCSLNNLKEKINLKKIY